MRFKKALALLLTCSIVVTEVPVFAAEREDSQGKEKVLAAKEELEADEPLMVHSAEQSPERYLAS